MKPLSALRLSGADVLPLVEGGKGIAATDGRSAGSWAAAGGVGTFSAVMADTYDALGRPLEMIFKGKNRKIRHEEMIQHSIIGGIEQAKIAHDIAGGQGRIHVNILWEMGGAQKILEGILDGAKGLIHGITCGAGMPFRLSAIAARFGVFYYPIVSSARAFHLLWMRAYRKHPEHLGAVVYEDPWRAGGHNGLSNKEDPKAPADPYPRVADLRAAMNRVGLHDTPIVMAGGVWALEEWADWIDDPAVAPVAFQFGTRPLLTQESPIPQAWKDRLPHLKPGEVTLQKFSPTGFYSSAVQNGFLDELEARSARQLAFREHQDGGFVHRMEIGPRRRVYYFTEADARHAQGWIDQGFDTLVRTPDDTVIFVSADRAKQIVADRAACIGCLSACRFSGWSEDEERITIAKPDPRSFCISKTLRDIAHGGDIDNNLMFGGHSVYRFGQDPFYAGGFIPTVKQLVDRLTTGK